MNVFVIGNGKVESIEIIKEYSGKSDLVICADGGAKYLYQAGIRPHILVGDFDSIDPALRKFYHDTGTEIIKFPRHKDYTDMELALDIALQKGATRVYITGATGTRLDHTLSNIQLLHKLADVGVEGVIINMNNYIHMVTDHIELQKREGFFLSLIPATPKVEGITTKGLAYPLKEAEMVMGTGLGISNEFTSDKAEVTVKKGRLYAIVSRD
ncbi:MAG: thiamine diphosphokinase [Clostridiaceae bacterium]|nr:thiamine diphosphokinase [Clostridiaceae bacterium]